MKPDISVTFTGLKFTNPFLLSSAPPTESDSNIMRAFDAGWGGVVTKTIGLHPVTNVAGPKTKFLRSTLDGKLSMNKRPETALHSSWNWALISAKPLARWIEIAGIKAYRSHLDRVDHGRLRQRKELGHWQHWRRPQDEGADAFELNLSCPHRIARTWVPTSDQGRCRSSPVVKEVASAGVVQAHAIDHRHRDERRFSAARLRRVVERSSSR